MTINRWMDKEVVYYSAIKRNAFESILIDFWFTFGDSVKIRESSSWINKDLPKTFHLFFTYLPIYFCFAFWKKSWKKTFYFGKSSRQTNIFTKLPYLYPPEVPFIFPKCYLFSHKYPSSPKSPVFHKVPFSPIPCHLLYSISTPSNYINAEKAEQFYEGLQDLLELTNTQKRCPFQYRRLECRSRKSWDARSNGQIWPWSTKWSKAKSNRV